ncbi:MAG: serine protease [Lachnospiraceae bacterium]|nr:serine protease [Lachnospiraceae bacterium]
MKEQHDSDYSFLQEKIKERPINRKKLIRTSLNTAVFAVVFGLVACFVFILLEPVIGRILNPPKEEPKQQIVLPAEEDEMLPEDMVQDEEELSEAQTPSETVTSEAPEAVELHVADYQKLYDKMRVIAYEAARSHVKVTAVREGTDWFQNRLESTNETSGMLVADNGVEILILCNQPTVAGASEIVVTFCNDYKANATLKKSDRNTGLAIVAVRLDEVNEKTKNEIKYARLGSSAATSIVGDLVIAIGSPLGYTDSLCYGMITSNRNPISMVDANYTLITTDIYGSRNASGMLVNTLGQVIGIIRQDYNAVEMRNQISAIGITELKRLIEDLSNERETPFLGLHVTDVTTEAQNSLGVPDGAFITEVVLMSPAMEHGLRKGDVITAMNGTAISSVVEYNAEMHNYAPQEEIRVTIMRQDVKGYQEMDIKVTLDLFE